MHVADTTHVLQFLAIVLTSGLAGAMNAIAGGGTLLTFPALIGLGISPLVANATSTVALWPGSVSRMCGYCDELTRSSRGAPLLSAASLMRCDMLVLLLLLTLLSLSPWLAPSYIRVVI